jgi:hypothetical protein
MSVPRSRREAREMMCAIERAYTRDGTRPERFSGAIAGDYAWTWMHGAAIVPRPEPSAGIPATVESA